MKEEMDNVTLQNCDNSYSGLLKLSEKGNTWTEYWAVLEYGDLRLYTNEECFKDGSKEVLLIRLSSQVLCEPLHKRCHFKLRVDSIIYRFKCASVFLRQQWLGRLKHALGSYCRKSCFHCYERDITVNRESSDNSEYISISSQGSSEIKFGSNWDDCLASENQTKTTRSPSDTETDSEDQVTSPSLILFDSQENLLSSFTRSSKGEKARPKTECEDDAFISRGSKHTRASSKPEDTSAIKNDNSEIFKTSSRIPSSVGDPELPDRISTSPLKIFEAQDHCFSTFSKKSSKRKRKLRPGFSNPAFTSEDSDDSPKISNRISKQFDAPLNYDVPSLSKGDPGRGYLKMLVGKKNWRRYRGVIEKNQLLLSDPERLEAGKEKDEIRIELKPDSQFVLLPRRNHDYRFKMITDPSTHHFLKCSTAFERDKWIQSLSLASQRVCQNTCEQCCRKYSSTSSRVTEAESTAIEVGNDEMVSDSSDEMDDVFYAEMADKEEAITFANPTNHSKPHDSSIQSVQENQEQVSLPASNEIYDDIHTAGSPHDIYELMPEATNVSPQRSSFLKTNAVGNEWRQYWAVIRGRKLLLYANENDAVEVKSIELSPHVMCRTAQRKSSSFRFTMILSASSSYEFKCSSAHDRKQWMASLEEIVSESKSRMTTFSKNLSNTPTVLDMAEEMKTTGNQSNLGAKEVPGTAGNVEVEKPEKEEKQEGREEQAQPRQLQQQQEKEKQQQEEQQQEQHQQLDEQPVYETITLTGNGNRNSEKDIEENDAFQTSRTFDQHVPIFTDVDGGNGIHRGTTKVNITGEDIKGSGDFMEPLVVRDTKSQKPKDNERESVTENPTAAKIIGSQKKNFKKVEDEVQQASNDTHPGGLTDPPEGGANSHSATALNLELRDTEEFITNVLGKVDLPPEVHKQCLELSQRLRKLLNKEDDAPKKPPQDETDQEFYDDVSQEVQKANEQQAHEPDQEMYDDVAGAQTKMAEQAETSDDVKSAEANEPQSETYDDVKPEDKSVKEVTENKVSNGASTASVSEDMYDDVAAGSKTASLGTQNVGEPKKVSDIKDKLCEGYMDKYRTKGLLKRSKWQRRFCVLSPLALYYYADPKDSRQRGTIILPSSDYVLREGSPGHPEVKDGKMCFELSCSERTYLFKVEKAADLDNWIRLIKSALKTELSEEDSKIIRTQSFSAKMQKEEETSEVTMDEDLYEAVDNFRSQPSHSSSETEPIKEEMYEETEQVSVKESSASSNEAPALPSRRKPGEEKAEEPAEDYELPGVGAKPPTESSGSSHETVQQDAEGTTEDYELPGVEAKPPTVSTRQPPQQKGKLAPPESPKLPPRSSSSQDAPQLPPRSDKSGQAFLQPPNLPNRTTPPSPKKAPPSPKSTPPIPSKAPTVTKEVEPSPTVKKPEVILSANTTAAPPPIKTKPTKGELFDYARVYVAMWNCNADDEDDLSFSRGNQLYIREKIPNSDWWVASLMDCPDIRVGLVPRNYIMPAYDM